MCGYRQEVFRLLGIVRRLNRAHLWLFGNSRVKCAGRKVLQPLVPRCFAGCNQGVLSKVHALDLLTAKVCCNLAGVGAHSNSV
jgi:hypothetical protein